jgi:DNA recombination protein RmuC
MEIALFGVVVAVIVLGFWFIAQEIKRSANNKPKDDGQSLLLIQNQIGELNRTLDSKLKETSEAAKFQFGESAKIIRDVTERLTKLDETNRQVVGFADQLQSLQDILKNPKQRGILGEYYLETLLKNVLPPGSWQSQYPFKDGTIVDAVVFVKDKIIPIDSKFSLENYNRLSEEKNEAERERLEKLFVNDLKLRIQETSKYIQPAQGTMDFAFMFIPHEAIYYDLLINRIGGVKDDDENLIQRAASKYHVIIVSPTSFLAYLQTVLQGLNALKIEESAMEIRKNVELLGKHLKSYDEYMAKLGVHLGTTVNTYNFASKELGKIDKDVYKITGEAMSIEPQVLAGPEKSE